MNLEIDVAGKMQAIEKKVEEGAPRRQESSQKIDIGSIKDLAEFTGKDSSPFSHWKLVFLAGLDGLLGNSTAPFNTSSQRDNGGANK